MLKTVQHDTAVYTMMLTLLVFKDNLQRGSSHFVVCNLNMPRELFTAAFEDIYAAALLDAKPHAYHQIRKLSMNLLKHTYPCYCLWCMLHFYMYVCKIANKPS
jgi:hypothetical protein